MSEFLHALNLYRSGVVSQDELLNEADRQLNAGEIDPSALLALIEEEHDRSELPGGLYRKLIERLQRPRVLVEFTETPARVFDSDTRPFESITASGVDPTQPVHHIGATTPVARRKPVVALGTVLKRRFRLIEKIGEGGMSSVYKAVDLRKVEARAADVHVAVKILTVPATDFAQSMATLQSEAQTLQSLPHPNIVRVIDCDRDGRTVFMTMENLSGESLKRKMIAHEVEGMPPAEAIRIIRSIGEGLAFAHRNGIIHGDLKPGNVFITDTGAVKIIDFGIARLLTRDPGATIAGDERPKLSALTPPYASPEMLEGGSPDPRDDIYALACIAHEILTGRHPFDRLVANDARDSGRRIINGGGLSRAQFKAIAHGLQFDRNLRTPTTEGFLHEFGTGSSVPARRVVMLVLAAVAIGLLALLLRHPDRALAWLKPNAANPAVSAAPQAAHAPAVGELFRDCPTCPLMKVLPPGSFQQGDPPDAPDGSTLARPQHAVAIAYPFGMGVYEVTVGEYKEFAQATQRPAGTCTTYDGAWAQHSEFNWSNVGFRQTDTHPVVCVSWQDASEYAQWLSRKTGKIYRLPSESEWEYAGRAGAALSRPWQDDASAACGIANLADRSAGQQYPGWAVEPCSDGFVFTAPVGSFTPNAFGLYDMLGNAFEWVEDCWHADYQLAPADGSAWLTGDCTERGLRGGSWFTAPGLVSLSARNRFSADYRSSSVGFRLLREVLQ